MASAYRGAVVEDLQLSPALVLPSDTTVDVALRMAFEREFSIIPISVPSTRRLLGWLSTEVLKSLVQSGQIDYASKLEDVQSNKGGAVTKFRKDSGYQVITPDTPLEELERFFTEGQSRGVTFALVTDEARKFVLGVVTPDDLYKFISRREPNYKPSFSVSTASSHQ